MFNKYFYINDNQSAITAARITAKSNEELGLKLESISQSEIKSKDRVDITLKEYLEMREKIEKLERKNSQRDKLIIQLGIPVEVIDKIIPSSVKVYQNVDPMRFTKQYQIRFNVEEFR